MNPTPPTRSTPHRRFKYTCAKQSILFISLFLSATAFAQGDNEASPPKEIKVENKPSKNANKILYGLASFYAQKFHGRQTANGEIFSHQKLTAACNVLPLGTWIQVTNLKNGKIIVVRTNDRLHPNTRRIIDLTHFGAEKLGFVKNGLTRVKIEILNQKMYKKPGKK